MHVKETLAISYQLFTKLISCHTLIALQQLELVSHSYIIIFLIPS